jgi:hypothetical protein
MECTLIMGNNMPNSYEHSMAGCLSGISLMGLFELISQSSAMQKNQRARIDWGAIVGKSAAGKIGLSRMDTVSKQMLACLIAGYLVFRFNY